MYITLRKGTQGSNQFLVRIFVNDDGPNRMLEVERARLRCTCDTFLENDECRHVKECQPELRQWQTRQLRKLRREAIGNETIAALSSRLNAKITGDLLNATIIQLQEGTFTLQWDSPAAERYADGCGWGTGGRFAEHITDWPDIVVLHLLQKEPDFLIWHWEIEEMMLCPHPPTPLPPRTSKPDWEQDATVSSSGQGLFDLLEAKRQSVDAQAINAAAWARFWAASCGLHLEDGDWQGRGSYLPGWLLGSEPVAALAFDLKDLRVKGLSASALQRTRKDMPADFHDRYAHVHLPWGQLLEDNLGYQVVVCNANGQPMRPYDNLLVLTTNVWADAGDMHSFTESLLWHMAELLLRMGQEPGSYLYHGREGTEIKTLAAAATISEKSQAWDIPAEGWKTLQEEILPAVAAEQQVDVHAWLDAHEGNDWAQVVPPC